MPYSIRIVPEKRLAIIRWWGEVTVWAEDELFPLLLSDERFGPGFGVLFDMLEAEPKATLSEFHASGDRHEILEKDMAPVWICYVVAGQVNYGMSRQYTAYHHETHAQRHVATSYEEALSWLSQFVGPLSAFDIEESAADTGDVVDSAPRETEVDAPAVAPEADPLKTNRPGCTG
jgi:hypothetical protein